VASRSPSLVSREGGSFHVNKVVVVAFFILNREKDFSFGGLIRGRRIDRQEEEEEISIRRHTVGGGWKRETLTPRWIVGSLISTDNPAGAHSKRKISKKKNKKTFFSSYFLIFLLSKGKRVECP
jgi:hypothetical protein